MEEIKLSDVRATSKVRGGKVSTPVIEMEQVSMPVSVSPVTNEMVGNF